MSAFDEVMTANIGHDLSAGKYLNIEFLLELATLLRLLARFSKGKVKGIYIFSVLYRRHGTLLWTIQSVWSCYKCWLAQSDNGCMGTYLYFQLWCRSNGERDPGGALFRAWTWCGKVQAIVQLQPLECSTRKVSFVQ